MNDIILWALDLFTLLVFLDFGLFESDNRPVFKGIKAIFSISCEIGTVWSGHDMLLFRLVDRNRKIWPVLCLILPNSTFKNGQSPGINTPASISTRVYFSCETEGELFGLSFGLVLLFLLLVFISVFSLFFVSHFSLLFENQRGCSYFIPDGGFFKLLLRYKYRLT